MKCQNCGFEFEGNFCSNCGAPASPAATYTTVSPVQPVQPAPYQYPVSEPKKHSAGTIIAIAFIAAIVFFGIGIISSFQFFTCADFFSPPVTDKGVVAVGGEVESGTFSYKVESIEWDEEYNGDKAQEGYSYMHVKVKVKNISKYFASNDYTARCYADDILCADVSYHTSWDEGSVIDPEKFCVDEHVYLVPDDAKNIEMKVSTFEADDILTSETQFTFKLR